VNIKAVPYSTDSLPSHWEVRQAKNLYDIQLGKMLQNQAEGPDDCEVPYLKALNVQWEHVETADLPSMWASPQDVAKYEVKKGDLLVCEGGEVGRAATIENLDGVTIIQNALHRVRPRCGNIRFFRYLLRHIAATGWFDVLCNRATIAHLTGEKLAAILVPTPPLPEQRAIADFLDRKTQAIDALIQKKERLIALLQEKRQALITQAVTKGFDPTVPMKDSGIEWLGEIPVHWEVKRLKHVCRLESGHTPRKSELTYWVPEECTIPWVSLNDTKTLEALDFISETKVKISPIGMANSSAHLIEGGAVIFNRDGARVGLAAITTMPMAVSQHIIAWVPSSEIRNKYLLNVLYAMEPEIYRITAGATIPTIGMPDVRRMVTPVPPLSEQDTIVQRVECSRRQIAHVADKVEKQIQLLREYRQALISAAVTGKIDVTKETI
jgi:type I restriction enzyme S subunit